MSQVDVAHVGQGLRKPNTIGFVGGQHAGKSAVMNTISKHLPGWVNTPAYFKPVGRTNERGTVDLGVFERPNSDWKFIDTAGRGFNPQGEDADKAYLARVRRGLKEFTDLVNPTSTDPQHPGWALDTSADASNAMEAIVYVLNAELLVGTQAVVHQERYKLFWTKEVIEQKEALTITQVREHLKLFYDAVYALTGWYPFVVVTHMDTVAGKYSEAQIRDLLSAFVHEDRIFFMTCIKLPRDKLTEDTAAAVDELLDTLKGHVEFYRAKQQKNQASASAQVVAAVSPFAAASDLGPSAPNLPVVSV